MVAQQCESSLGCGRSGVSSGRVAASINGRVRSRSAGSDPTERQPLGSGALGSGTVSPFSYCQVEQVLKEKKEEEEKKNQSLLILSAVAPTCRIPGRTLDTWSGSESHTAGRLINRVSDAPLACARPLA